MDERGELIRDYPRTFSFKNWPFFVFLVFLGGVLATFAYVAENMKGAVAIGVGTVLLPIPFYVAARLAQNWRATLCGLYEKGLLVDFKGATHFLPWDSFVELRTWRQRTDADGPYEVEIRVVQLTSRSGVVITLTQESALQLVDERVRLTAIDEGLKRW